MNLIEGKLNRFLQDLTSTVMDVGLSGYRYVLELTDLVLCAGNVCSGTGVFVIVFETLTHNENLI